MRFTALLVVCLALPIHAAELETAPAESKARTAVDATGRELRRYGRDMKSMALAPLRWDRAQWTRLGEGAALVAVVYAADRELYDAVQRNRSSFTDDFAKVITPFGARRAEVISAALIVAGSMTGDDRMRDAGRDALEADIWAGGIVTPLLKRGFGRSRPLTDEGARAFDPFSKNRSFPSGHATNAFAAATAIASHYDDWEVPTLVYTIATGVAFSRVNDRQHFPSDVVAGALIGRAVAKGVAWRHRTAAGSVTVAPAMFDGAPGILVRLSPN